MYIANNLWLTTYGMTSGPEANEIGNGYYNKLGSLDCPRCSYLRLLSSIFQLNFLYPKQR